MTRAAVCLTLAGRRLIEKIFPGHVAAIVAELDAMTPAEQEALGRLCRKLGRREGQAERHPA